MFRVSEVEYIRHKLTQFVGVQDTSAEEVKSGGPV